MTVVEAYVGKKKINLPDDSSQLHPQVSTLLSEGIAQNTTGNVFEPKVIFLFRCRRIIKGGRTLFSSTVELWWLFSIEHIDN